MEGEVMVHYVAGAIHISQQHRQEESQKQQPMKQK